jgi:Transglycosylase SLT domain
VPRPRSLLVVSVAAVTVAASGVAGAVVLSHDSGSSSHPAAAGLIRSVPSAQAAAAGRSQQRVALVPVPRRLEPPDALVELAGSAGRSQLAEARRIAGVRAIAVLDRGDVRVDPGTGAAVPLRVVAGDLAALRGFTPRYTAASSPLWESLARGELTVGFSAAGRLTPLLGATLISAGPSHIAVPLRLGAFATIGLGDAQAVVDPAAGRLLGLRPRAAVVVSAPGMSIDELRGRLRQVFGARATIQVLRPRAVDQAEISAYARAVVPAAYLSLYRRAATTCPGLPWTVLAAIGTVETGNGANVHRSSKGALGPMQFLPSTFAAYGIDGDGDGVANIQDPADAVFSAARYLCLWGAGLGGQALDDAIFAYNHADWYVREVIELAIAYT